MIALDQIGHRLQHGRDAVTKALHGRWRPGARTAALAVEPDPEAVGPVELYERRDQLARHLQIERLLHLAQAGAAGSCPNCGALHARGAGFCWQCGTWLLSAQPSSVA